MGHREGQESYLGELRLGPQVLSSSVVVASTPPLLLSSVVRQYSSVSPIMSLSLQKSVVESGESTHLLYTVTISNIDRH